MAIKASLRKVYDPFLTLSGVKHPFVGNQPIRFFGGTVQVPSNIQPACELLQNKPTSLLERVSCTPETDICRAPAGALQISSSISVCAHITWDLTQLPLWWVETPSDPLARRHLKCWLGLAKAADPSRMYMYLPKEHEDLCLPSVSEGT